MGSLDIVNLSIKTDDNLSSSNGSRVWKWDRSCLCEMSMCPKNIQHPNSDIDSTGNSLEMTGICAKNSNPGLKRVDWAGLIKKDSPVYYRTNSDC
jgi:hypothetical protein